MRRYPSNPFWQGGMMIHNLHFLWLFWFILFVKLIGAAFRQSIYGGSRGKSDTQITNDPLDPPVLNIKNYNSGSWKSVTNISPWIGHDEASNAAPIGRNTTNMMAVYFYTSARRAQSISNIFLTKGSFYDEILKLDIPLTSPNGSNNSRLGLQTSPIMALFPSLPPFRVASGNPPTW